MRCYFWNASVRGACAGILLLLSAGCGGQIEINDPLMTLTTIGETPGRQERAMAMLDHDVESADYLAALHRVLWRSGYTVPVREAAFARLEVIDPQGLKRTLRQRLPRMDAWAARSRYCEMIADRGWTVLTPALVSSWAQPVIFVPNDEERPEYLALASMHGADRVASVIFDLLVESNRVSDMGLRTRCWNLLHRLGERDRLRELLARTDLPETDLFLRDLQAGLIELGVLPRMREEILWVRKLRGEQFADWWSEARGAVAQLTPERRGQLELRDLAMVVSAARHDPALLTASRSELYQRLERQLAGQRHYSHGSRFEGYNSDARERLYQWKEELRWGDLAAMLLALQAFEVQPFVRHLFDYAERDRLDTTTEYGGIIQLDRKGRFELLEFPPRIREHDQKFIASQALFDASYTALFHFHYHVQREGNKEYAGPGFGDANFADNTRANCLVLTSVERGVMNVDYYRHGRLQVDLGVIRSEAPSG